MLCIVYLLYSVHHKMLFNNLPVQCQTANYAAMNGFDTLRRLNAKDF